MIELQPDILNYYKSFFVHKMRDEYTRVASGIPKLPKSKNIESAEKFGNLEMILRNLRDLMNKLIDNDYLNDQEVKNISKQISSQYCDMNATLSQLLEEILAGLGSV